MDTEVLPDGLPDTFDPVGGLGNKAPAPTNYADLVKQDLAELDKTDHTFIPVQGYESAKLQIKYRAPISGRELSDVARPLVKQYQNDDYGRNLAIAIDSIIELCDGLYIQPPELDKPITFDPDLSGIPCKFDERLSEALGWTDVHSARQSVRKLFSNNEVAILAHAEELNRWLKNKKLGLSEDFLASLR